MNFRHRADAARALMDMNFDEFMGRNIRIMWRPDETKQRGLLSCKVLVRNLHQSINSTGLYDMFREFGSIVSCEVGTHANGASNIYGYVLFENESDANEAIEKFRSIKPNNKDVLAYKFKPSMDRDDKLPFTEVFVQNFDKDMNDKSLEELFKRFGSIKSCKVVVGEDGSNKGYGFVNFENHEQAKAAVVEMNGFKVDSRALLVDRALNKKETLAKLRKKPVDLYIENLDETINEEQLRKRFAHYGNIKKVSMIRDTRSSNAVGFVSFFTHDEASHALFWTDGGIVGKNPVLVSFAQQRGDKNVQLVRRHKDQFVNQLIQNVNPAYSDPPPQSADISRFAETAGQHTAALAGLGNSGVIQNSSVSVCPPYSYSSLQSAYNRTNQQAADASLLTAHIRNPAQFPVQSNDLHTGPTETVMVASGAHISNFGDAVIHSSRNPMPLVNLGRGTNISNLSTAMIQSSRDPMTPVNLASGTNISNLQNTRDHERNKRLGDPL